MSDERDWSDHYVWFDTEYSGLELEHAHLLQVALMITDSSLHRLVPAGRDPRLVVRLPADAAVSPWVEAHLPELVRACRGSEALPAADADLRLAAHLDAVFGPPAATEKCRPVLAGNSVHADWFLARKFLPRFLSRLHYRHLDVTALKLEWKSRASGPEFEKENPALIRAHFPDAELPAEGKRHDAYYDVQASAAELAFYRRHLFSAPAGDGPVQKVQFTETPPTRAESSP